MLIIKIWTAFGQQELFLVYSGPGVGVCPLRMKTFLFPYNMLQTVKKLIWLFPPLMIPKMCTLSSLFTLKV